MALSFSDLAAMMEAIVRKGWSLFRAPIRHPVNDVPPKARIRSGDEKRQRDFSWITVLEAVA
jgi:hypothetical protein